MGSKGSSGNEMRLWMLGGGSDINGAGKERQLWSLCVAMEAACLLDGQELAL